MDADEAVRLRRAINKLARHFNASATDEGLTPTQASVLGLIASRGPISPADLVKIEHLNPTMLSRVIGRLVESELVTRATDPDDLRSATLSATDNGQAVHQRIRAQRAESVSRSAGRLDERDHAELVGALIVLERLVQELD